MIAPVPAGATARFRVTLATGAPRYGGCLTGSRIDHCAKIPTATPQYGRRSGLYRISALVARAKTLYAAVRGDDVARFSLAPQTKITKTRITDRAGTTDPTPAKRRWRVRG